MQEKYLAHISEDGKEQLLIDHLKETAGLAESFAEDFNCGAWGYGSGLLHDIGKYTSGFQDRLHGSPKRVDHSTAGCLELNKSGNLMAAYCVAGHHAGLSDGGSETDTADSPTLCGRLKKPVEDYRIYQTEVEIPHFPVPPLKAIGKGGFSVSFFIRMIYSCLVDADFLNTEQFMSNGMIKRSIFDSMETLFARLQVKIEPWLKNTDINSVNGRRSEILRSCLEMGAGDQGLYSLTVPTGGGKTISSMAFALAHAVRHGLNRIIYVIPYTSIIEQNAKVFSDWLGEQNVLENHSNVEYSGEEELNLKQLAAENWDKPVVVTTNVQFFESLFANKSSKCRKLHNISKSVIIFDEAQMLPAEYLKPCVRAIAELVCNYKSTAVICTATQPSLQKLFPKEITCREICPRVEEQYQFFKRTVLKNFGQLDQEELLTILEKQEQSLCILNSRKRVRALYDVLKERRTGVFHLSTLMYPKHRRRVLKQIRDCLDNHKPCLVIATSLVEAGVDLDFPAVFRELAGIDSVIQAAGRCNREGRGKAEDCITYLFTMEEGGTIRLPSALKQPIGVSGQILRDYEDVSSLEAIKDYFDRLHDLKGDSLDRKRIIDAFEQASLKSFPFRRIGEEFHLIESNTRTVLIEKEETAAEIIRQLRLGLRSRELVRKAGQYSVNVYEQDYENLRAAGMLEELDEEVTLLRNLDDYSEEAGLKIEVNRGDAVFF
ncbi:CRISPR-associated helicase Cas3' [Anaerolentibacter hominis]|uniref:CRISPR-associated helicase Cas3' n=1 Tax=Anaerolentibacter hominis TaxID=3079009 RepID=UPI0031B898AA